MEFVRAFQTFLTQKEVAYVAIGALVVTWLFVVLTMVLHALYFTGFKTFLYRKVQPVDGWSRQFYAVTIGLLVYIGALIAVVFYYFL